MKVYDELINLAIAYIGSKETVDQMARLYELRTMIVDRPLDLTLSLDQRLHEMEAFLVTEEDKNKLRALGYAFPEDLDHPTEFL